jgi:hypothetical protein
MYYFGNLSRFLIPFFLPWAFEQYFEQKKKFEAKELEWKAHLPTPAPPHLENKYGLVGWGFWLLQISATSLLPDDNENLDPKHFNQISTYMFFFMICGK